MPLGLPLIPKAAGLDSSIAWLRDHDVPANRIAALFGITDGHARQLAYRGQWRTRENLVTLDDAFAPVSDAVRLQLKIRPADDSATVKLDPAARLRLADLEDRVEMLSSEFWDGVRNGVGVDRFRGILIEIGRPAHFRRIRLLARVRQLLAETYLHIGYAASAIHEGASSLLLSKAAHEESLDPHDLRQFAKTALIISQAHLLRFETAQSAHCLDLYRDANARISQVAGGEYFRQRGVAAFQTGKAADEDARENFSRAMTVLAETVEQGRVKPKYEVLSIGARQMNLVGNVNWDGAQELLDYMVATSPPGGLHIPVNANWAAACGLSIDSPSAAKAAVDVLSRFAGASAGYGHQATVSWLLSITPSLPRDLRSDWARRALYENTFKDY